MHGKSAEAEQADEALSRERKSDQGRSTPRTPSRVAQK